MRTAILFLLGILCGPAGSAAADVRLDRALAGAREVGQAVMTKDFRTVVKKTYPKIAEMIGGPEKMERLIRSSMEALAKQGFKIKRVSAMPAKKLTTGGKKLFAIVPTRTEMTAPNGGLIQDGYLLAISGDNGKSWTYIDGAGINPSSIKQVVREFPAGLKLPERRPPTFVKPS